MKRFLSLVLIAFALGACNKFDNGGLVKNADKNLTRQTWKLDKYLRNGNDETSALLISNFEETWQDGGTLIRNYAYDGNQVTETGSWELKTDTEQVKIDGVSSLQLTNQTSTVSTSDVEILRLKKKEFWYFFDNGSDRHEFRFVPKN